MSKLPLLNQEPLYHVDGTPNNDYVLRILRVYRHNAGCNWVADPPSPLLDEMNRVNALRAKLLDEAIEILVNAKNKGKTSRRKVNM